MEVGLAISSTMLVEANLQLVTMYISPTTQADDPKIGVLYLTDAFGIPLLQNKLCVSNRDIGPE